MPAFGHDPTISRALQELVDRPGSELPGQPETSGATKTTAPCFADLDLAKAAVLASLRSSGSRRCYEYALVEFIEPPRLAKGRLSFVILIVRSPKTVGASSSGAPRSAGPCAGFKKRVDFQEHQTAVTLTIRTV